MNSYEPGIEKAKVRAALVIERATLKADWGEAMEGRNYEMAAMFSSAYEAHEKVWGDL